MNRTNTAQTFRKVRTAAQAGFLLVLLLLIWTSGRAGFASLLYAYAARENQPAAAAAAVALSPNDAQAHYIRGAVFEISEAPSAALAEYTRAVTLRPRDFALWLALAQARELNGNTSGAIAAATEAEFRAPFYAQPRWQLGNLLIRAGRVDDGFGKLRLAVESDPTLLPAVIDLASHFAGNKAEYVLAAIQPHSPDAYKALADYFQERGQASEAIAMFRLAGRAADQERRSYLEALISTQQFRNAFDLWATRHPPEPDGSAISDPGFERGSDLDEPGFGWRAQKAQNISLALDGLNPKDGKWSLAVTFNGDSDPAQAVISQLVLVEPQTTYQLHCAVRTEGLVSGGLPYLSISDAASQQILTQTAAFPLNSGWQDYTTNFTTSETGVAIQIAVRRLLCSKNPCPIFGGLWLDNFTLRKI